MNVKDVNVQKFLTILVLAIVNFFSIFFSQHMNCIVKHHHLCTSMYSLGCILNTL